MSSTSEMHGLTVVRAAEDLAAGRMVVVCDDADRENEGDLVIAAQYATPKAVGFIVRHTSGILCAPMTADRADALDLPLMVDDNRDLHETAFTVSVDAVGTGTGISAEDRSETTRALAATDTPPEVLRRPGHVFPLRAREGGVLKRAGHTEAAVDLMRIAGLEPVALISELVDDDGSVLKPDGVRRFAEEHGLTVLNVADLIQYRRRREGLVERAGEAALPTQWGTFRAVSYRSVLDGIEHLALSMGDVAFASDPEPVLVRVHSECLTGDLFGSKRCDCGPQLQTALARIAEEGRGCLVYLRGHEGRGIGLAHKLRAYSLQDRGADTLEANVALGLPVDSREYGVGAQILTDIGVRSLRLMTNNPAKYGGLEGYDLEVVERVALVAGVSEQNLSYLRTKRDRLGHRFDDLDSHLRST